MANGISVLGVYFLECFLSCDLRVASDLVVDAEDRKTKMHSNATGDSGISADSHSTGAATNESFVLERNGDGENIFAFLSFVVDKMVQRAT